MLKLTVILAILLLVVSQPVQSEASPPDYYDTAYPAIPGLTGIPAGTATWAIAYPTSIPGAGTYYIAISAFTSTAALTGISVNPTGTTHITPGCSYGAFVADPATFSSQSGFLPVVVSAGTKYCSGDVRMLLTLTPPASILLASMRFAWEFEVETRENANYVFLCDAPGNTLFAYSQTATLCETANIYTPAIDNFTNALCRPTGNHGHCELDIHGGLDIAQDGPWEVNTNTNITIMGNISLNGTIGGNGTAGEGQPEGFNGSLYILLAAIGLALARTAEVRGNHGYRVIAGGIFVIAPIAIWYEMERLGFNHIPQAVAFAMVFFAINWILAIYLFTPKDGDETDG